LINTSATRSRSQRLRRTGKSVLRTSQPWATPHAGGFRIPLLHGRYGELFSNLFLLVLWSTGPVYSPAIPTEKTYTLLIVFWGNLEYFGDLFGFRSSWKYYLELASSAQLARGIPGPRAMWVRVSTETGFANPFRSLSFGFQNRAPTVSVNDQGGSQTHR
jgi:hypothetical protein